MIRRYDRVGRAPANQGITLWGLGITDGRTEINRHRQKDHEDQNRKYSSHDYLPQPETWAGAPETYARICANIFSIADGSFNSPLRIPSASSPIGGSMVSARMCRRISPATNSVVILGTSAPLLMSVSIVVGITVITCTPLSDRYARKAWPSESSAAFEAQ